MTNTHKSNHTALNTKLKHGANTQYLNAVIQHTKFQPYDLKHKINTQKIKRTILKHNLTTQCSNTILNAALKHTNV